MKDKKLVRFQFLASLTCVIVMAASLLGQDAGRGRIIANRTEGIADAQSLSRAFQAATDVILKSVVKVRTVSNSGGKRVLVGGFFPMEVPEQEGLGSGVIIDPDGIIMTNNHVVKDAEEVIIVMHDGTELQAIEYKTDHSRIWRLCASKPRTAYPRRSWGTRTP